MKSKFCVCLIVLVTVVFLVLVVQDIDISKDLTSSQMEALIGGDCEGGGCGKHWHKDCDEPDVYCWCREAEGQTPGLCSSTPTPRNAKIVYESGVEFDMCEGPGDCYCYNPSEEMLCYTRWLCQDGNMNIHSRCGSMNCYKDKNTVGWRCRECTEGGPPTRYYVCDWEYTCE